MSGSPLGSGWSGRLVVISGPSGVGKSTLCEGLLGLPRVSRAITATSRAPRRGERDGVDYLFLERAAFEKEIERGGFLEHAEVHGNLYGTPVGPLRQLLEAGNVALLVIDVQGANILLEKKIPAEFVFIEPPDLKELENRLRARGTESEDSIRVRLMNARKEMAQRDRYPHRIVNDDLNTAVAELKKLLGL